MSQSPADQLGYNPLLQRFFLSPEEKASIEKGKGIISAIYRTQTANSTDMNFFFARSQQWSNLIYWSVGRQDMKQFLDYMSVTDANKAWVNLDMTPVRLGPQFVGTLVESMAKTRVYPSVNAIDDGSVSEKEQRFYDALFRMREVELINDLQQQSGVQMEPTGAYVPDDETSAKVYFKLEDRLPKEIRFEQLLSCIQNAIQFERVLNRKTLFDLTVLNCGVTKIEKLGPKQYTVRKCVGTNMTYNFFMSDTGDCELTQIGEFYNLKVKDFRSKYGKNDERPDGLTEKEIFDLAKLSQMKNIGQFNYMWQNQWASNSYYMNRPYDDCSILVFDCEVNCGEDQYYVGKTDSYGKENIEAKKGVPYQQKTKTGEVIEQPKPENAKIYKTNKNTWWRGVYCPYGDKMLYWGRPDLIITPYTNVSKPLSSYTINIPNNTGDYVPSLFERIMEPLREYQLTKLKRKQLIAQVRPAGIRIDVESARNIDLGNGDTIAWEEVLRIFNQTGTEVWSSKGLDPLQKEMPAITNTAADDSVRKIMELTNVLAGIVSEIRQLIGVPQYRDGSDVGDRTSGVLQEQQNQASYNVSDYVLNANNQLWEETFYKLCLLHWNDIVKEEPESKEDLINTRFEIKIKMRSTDYDKEQLEKDIDRYSQVPDAMGNPSLSLKDAMMIREIDDPKLARWYLSTTYEKNRRDAMEEKDRLTKATAEAQNVSLQQSAKNDLALQKEKYQQEKDMKEFEATKNKEVKLLEIFGQVAAKDESGNMIKMFLPAIQQLVPNIQIPLAVENQQMQQDIQMQAQQEQMAAQQEAMEQEQGVQHNPQEEIAEQQM